MKFKKLFPLSLLAMMMFGAAFGASPAIAQEATAKKPTLSEQDRLLIAVQKICPVTGSELGSMGDPVKVQIGEQVAFLCCKGCAGKKVKPENWSKIQANIATAQGTCPIMGKAVDSSMKSTVIKGQLIFVCCPPCIPKIKAAPDANLKKVYASFTKHVASLRQAESDKAHIAAQGICPVTGKKLGSMGAPVKVKVGEEHAFLCCKGCVGKKIDAEHWATIQKNLAAAQGTCPVMDEEVDATMESVVVSGRKIFVCCPPCIKKIQEKPATFIDKVNQQIVANLKESDSKK